MKNKLKILPHPQSWVSMMRIFKIEIAISMVMLSAMALLAMMILAKVSSTLLESTESRISVILYDMRDNIEQGLALGINLKGLGNTQDMIQRAARRDSKISTIYVIDKRGDVVYRTPLDAVDLTGQEIVDVEKAVKKRPVFSSRNEDMVKTVTALKNSFGLQVGLLVINYDANNMQQRFTSFRTEFLYQAFLFLIGGIVLTAVVTWLVVRLFEKTDATLAHAMDGGSNTRSEAIIATSEFVTFRQKEDEIASALNEVEKALDIK